MSTPTVTPVSYDLEGAAQALGLSVREVQRAVAEGDLTPHYRGKKPLFKPAELEAFVDALPTTKKSGEDR